MVRRNIRDKLGSKIWSSPVIADYGIVYVTYEDNGACKLIAIDCGIEGPAKFTMGTARTECKKEMLYKNKKDMLRKINILIALTLLIIGGLEAQNHSDKIIANLQKPASNSVLVVSHRA